MTRSCSGLRALRLKQWWGNGDVFLHHLLIQPDHLLVVVNVGAGMCEQAASWAVENSHPGVLEEGEGGAVDGFDLIVSKYFDGWVGVRHRLPGKLAKAARFSSCS